MGKASRNKRKRTGANKSGKNRTPLSGHTIVGKELVPPFAKMEKIVPTSWTNDRLPEMVWAALIRIFLDQDHALGLFRRYLNFIGKHEKASSLYNATLTGFSKLDETLREEVIRFLTQPPEAAQALATLRLFKTLPARSTWDKFLPQIAPDPELLMEAVGATLWHQSQEATDCRWTKVMAQVVAGKFHVPGEIVTQWLGYPNEGDQRSVRPSIRAAEMAENPLEPRDLTWPKAFWQEAWENTPCLELAPARSIVLPDTIVTRPRIQKAVELLGSHWNQTHSTTAVDAKHDGVFGMSFYALRILEEMLGIGVESSVLGRLGLRTILEVHINLRVLLGNDDDALWQKWRTYGAAQAKLNALKFDETVDPPRYIDVESIERIAGEDLWEEFLKINLASWSGTDLRRMSEQSGLKGTYDKFYSWTSGYAHGMWGPIRESCYQTCGNPLHRLHRYPSRNVLQDTLDDAAELVDEILGDLDKAYPEFPHRLARQEHGTEPMRAPGRQEKAPASR